MTLQRIVFTLITLTILTVFCFSQTNNKNLSSENVSIVKASAAYTEVLLKRTELEAELEDLLVNYTREYPKVKEIQIQLEIIKGIMTRLFAVKPSESQKLTSALGKLLLKKLELETELWNLQKKYNEEHPEIKKINRKILVYESAIKDVLF